MGLPHPFTVTPVSEVLFSQFHKLHKTLTLILSNHGLTFLYTSWEHLFMHVDTLLIYNLDYNPQTDEKI